MDALIDPLRRERDIEARAARDYRLSLRRRTAAQLTRRRLIMQDPGGRAAAAPFNAPVAERLRKAAALLARQDDDPYRIAAYWRAATNTDVLGFLEAGGIDALKQIPGVGERIADVRGGKRPCSPKCWRGSSNPQRTD